MTPPRLHLSPPHLGTREAALVAEAFATNWIAPLGPNVDAFEAEFAAKVGSPNAVALSSGTAALHLALILAGVGAGDEVVVSTLTFAASANPVRYLGATPVFVDSEPNTWNMDPGLLAETLDARARHGRLPKAVILVHLYGQSADIDPIAEACARHGVTLIEDAAEALGASYKGQAPGTVGETGIYSFNGNKIITTSGGGMLVTKSASLAAHARKLATQARDAAPHYEHSEIGFNYRLSNVLAGIGRGQLEVLEDRVLARRAVFARYKAAFRDLAGISLMPETTFDDMRSRANRWLTCVLIDPTVFGVSREDVRLALEAENIEARPVWKPMHLQPVYQGAPVVGGACAERLFQYGLCLPSGSAMTVEQQKRVVNVVRRVHVQASRASRTA